MVTNSWCQVCDMARKDIIINDLPIDEINIDIDFDFAVANEITLVPTFIKMVDDMVVEKKVGMMSEEQLKEFIEG